MQNLGHFTPQPTADGSFTFFSPEFGECFHSPFGALKEAQMTYANACQLALKAKTGKVRLLDVCYGLGYNSAAALATIWASNPNCEIELIGLELDATVPREAIAHSLLNAWPDPIPDLLQTLAQNHQLQIPQLQAQLLISDARTTIQQVYSSGFQADAIFLDPFSPPQCPQLWTVEFLEYVAKCLSPTGKLSTYCSAAAPRSALRLAGLAIASLIGVGAKLGTLASYSTEDLPPLSQKEEEHLQTRAAVPYRDPTLNATADEIKQRRQQEQQLSPLEPSNQWKKRWSKV